MRIMPLLKAACPLSLMLSACGGPLLMMSPTSQLMWVPLKPLVGFIRTREANLFEQPLIKDSGMTDSSTQLRQHHAAAQDAYNELQQEAAVLRGLPLRPAPDVAKQAGMVGTPTPTSSSCCRRETARLRYLAKPDGGDPDLAERYAVEWQAGNPTATALTDAGMVMTGNPRFPVWQVMGNLQQRGDPGPWPTPPAR